MRKRPGLREVELIGSLAWYINIRWVAVFFIAAVFLISISVFGVDVPLEIILPAIIAIIIYNTASLLYLKKIKSPEIVPVNLPQRAARFVLFQATADLLLLLVLIHYTGGAENPFIFYFIFHTVLSSLMLPKKTCYRQSAAVTLSVGALVLAEYFSFIPHHHLKGFIEAELYENPKYLISVYLVFASTMFFATYLAVTVSEKLWEKETELEEKSGELEKANESLMEKDRLKSEYVMMVAHDIKSPLSSILSLIAAVTEGYSGKLPEKTLELLIRAGTKAASLHGYASDLLNLSRIRSQKSLDLKPVDMETLVEEAVSMAAPEKEGKELDIKVEFERGLPPLIADREQMLHAVLNLVGNAVKYTPSGGAIRVEGKRKENQFLLTISDTGVGIPKEDLPHIFDEFFRGGNGEKFSKGAGLGLSLVKFIVERHGGTITVESELGKGTSFYLKLPCKI
ncbi:MAG TPA: HAMP domain-containing sensor histidine kinase [Thermodesulfobacteriota bacterium]|nr:HAMP domain-containing sensor histidine kinase [Thermodesulfobacteriota bacterium]